MLVKIKTVYDHEDEIPEGYGDLYIERNGRFELAGVEGLKTQVSTDHTEEEELRETKAALAKFGELNPEEIFVQLEELAEAKARLATLTGDGRVDESFVQARINAAVERAVGPLQRQLNAQKRITATKESVIGNLQDSIKRDSGPTGQDPGNPWSASGWNVTAQGRYIKQYGSAKAVEAAESVGSRIGATKPTMMAN